MVRHGRRVYEVADRMKKEHGVPMDEWLPIDDTINPAFSDLPEKNLPHARAVFQAFAESPLAEDRVEGAGMMLWLIDHDHDFAYGLWHRLARDPAKVVRAEAVDDLRRRLDYLEAHSDASEYFVRELGVTPQEAAELIRVAGQVDRGEIPPFDLGQETLAIALGHAALPDWLRTPGNDT